MQTRLKFGSLFSWCAWTLLLCSGALVASGLASAQPLADGQGNTITQSVAGASGGPSAGGGLSLRSAVGQGATGVSTSGTFLLSHGALASMPGEGEPEGEGEGEGEGAPEGEGEPEPCVAEGAPVSANEGDSVCLSLPSGCEPDPVDPMYQWFKDGEPTALVDIPGELSGVNSAELCFASVSEEDAGVYILVYESANKTTSQYSVELQVQSVSALPLGGVWVLLALCGLLALGAFQSIRRNKNDKSPAAGFGN